MEKAGLHPGWVGGSSQGHMKTTTTIHAHIYTYWWVADANEKSHFDPTLRATATQSDGRARQFFFFFFIEENNNTYPYFGSFRAFFFTYTFHRQPTPLRDAWSSCASLFSLQNKPQSHLQQSVWTHRSLTLVLRGWSLYLQTFTGRTDCWSTAAPSQWQPGSSRL